VRVIERDWFELGEWRLDAEARCTRCGTAIPGVFAPNGPGDWGARRLPVRLAVAADRPPAA
jgi:pyruvate formate lyase activating enzyme